MKKLRVLKAILVRTRAADMLVVYLLFVLAAALVIVLAEPDIHTYGDALWYCYAVISTAGFGDVVVTTWIGKVTSAVLTVYSVFVIAIVTGVVVNFYNQILRLQQEETLASFLNRMERLPEMTEEELREMSKKAAFFRQKRSEIQAEEKEKRKLDL